MGSYIDHPIRDNLVSIGIGFFIGAITVSAIFLRFVVK